MPLVSNAVGYNPYQPTPGQAVGQAVDGLARTVDQLGNALGSVAQDVRVATSQPYYPGYSYPQYPVYQQPEQGISMGRMVAWAGGAYGAFALAANAFSRRPEGLMVLAIVGAGAWAGNHVYNWLKTKQIL